MVSPHVTGGRSDSNPSRREGHALTGQRFRLDGEVRTADRRGVLAALTALLPEGRIEENEARFRVEAQLEGESARELNRSLLSALRRIERRTTLRSQWTSDGTLERFFDYVPKSAPPAK
jgi:hypothetical protein